MDATGKDVEAEPAKDEADGAHGQPRRHHAGAADRSNHCDSILVRLRSPVLSTWSWRSTRKPPSPREARWPAGNELGWGGSTIQVR